MDIEKSQRLIKFANLIKDTVEYKEISEYLLQSKVLTMTDHQGLNNCIQNQGNSYGMEDLIHILGLRRGGFNAFVEALRQNDYDWIADQMDPQTRNCEGTSSSASTHKGIFPTLTNGLKKRKSRTSERLSSETTFTSYRDNMPMDLKTRPAKPRVVSQEIPPSRTKFQLQNPAKFISASLDNLKLDDHETRRQERYQSSQMDLTDSSSATIEKPKGDDSSSKGKRSVLLYNIPEPETVLALSREGTLPLSTSSTTDVKIISKIAQKLQFPDEHLKGLKAVRVGRVAKTEKSKVVARPLKVKFKSQEGRDRFMLLIQSQIEGVLSEDSDLAEIQVLPYDKGTLKRSKSNWWGQSRFLSLKRNKMQKIKETNS